MSETKSNLSTMINRYSRQMLIPQIGLFHQQNFLSSYVCVIGAGGIGSTVLLYLAGAGIGTIHIIDDDVVEESNLHRQIIHSTSSIKSSKAQSAKDRILSLNPNINVIISPCRLVATNALSLLKSADLVIDATDNFEARYVINDACVCLNKPFISGSSVSLEGQIFVTIPYKTPCYRCLYPQTSSVDSCRGCDSFGVLGPIPGLIGCLEAIEAIKLLSSLSRSSSLDHHHHHQQQQQSQPQQIPPLESLIGKQIFYDGLTSQFFNFDLGERNKTCKACGGGDDNDNDKEIESKDRKMMDLSSSLPPISISLHPELLQLSDKNHLDCKTYATSVLCNGKPHVLLDVRSRVQYDMINLKSYYSSMPFPGVIEHEDHWMMKRPCYYISVSLKYLLSKSSTDFLNDLLVLRRRLPPHFIEYKVPDLYRSGDVISFIEEELKNEEVELLPIYLLCRRGIDSVSATQFLERRRYESVINLDGGFISWKSLVDPSFPSY